MDEVMQAATASLLIDMDGGPHGSGINAMLEQARRQGYEEGYHAATSELITAESNERATRLRLMAESLSVAAAQVVEARRSAVDVAAAEAAELAYELATAFLQRELAVGRPAIEAVARALALVPDEEDLTIRVNPSDPISAEEIVAMVPDAGVKVIPDPRVETGGCVIQAGPCRIDTQLGAALERVRRILADAYPGSSAAALAVVPQVEVA